MLLYKAANRLVHFPKTPYLLVRDMTSCEHRRKYATAAAGQINILSSGNAKEPKLCNMKNKPIGLHVQVMQSQAIQQAK